MAEVRSGQRRNVSGGRSLRAEKERAEKEDAGIERSNTGIFYFYVGPPYGPDIVEEEIVKDQ
jgi:hypothetical protein